MEYNNEQKYSPNKYSKYNYYDKKNPYQKKNYNNRNALNLKRLIFPPIPEEKLHQLMIDDESYKFITFTSSAQEITNIIMNSLIDFPCPSTENKNEWDNKNLINKMERLVITEMTAGVGGNVLNFAKYFKYVNAVEIDNTRYQYLKKNISLYNFQNVNCYNANSVDLLIDKDDIAQDIVFFDPPWGGKNYKAFDNLRLKFEEYSIENICHILFGREQTKMIVMKLPNNYDFVYLNEELKEYKISKILLDRMTIIVVKKYKPELF